MNRTPLMQSYDQDTWMAEIDATKNVLPLRDFYLAHCSRRPRRGHADVHLGTSFESDSCVITRGHYQFLYSTLDKTKVPWRLLVAHPSVSSYLYGSKQEKDELTVLIDAYCGTPFTIEKGLITYTKEPPVISHVFFDNTGAVSLKVGREQRKPVILYGLERVLGALPNHAEKIAQQLPEFQKELQLAFGNG